MIEYEEEAKKFKKTPCNFKLESIKYCLNDSVLLRKILNYFSEFIFNSFNIDINKYPTIYSLAFAIFRSIYLKEGEVGIIPSPKAIIIKYIKILDKLTLVELRKCLFLLLTSLIEF